VACLRGPRELDRSGSGGKVRSPFTLYIAGSRAKKSGRIKKSFLSMNGELPPGRPLTPEEEDDLAFR